MLLRWPGLRIINADLSNVHPRHFFVNGTVPTVPNWDLFLSRLILMHIMWCKHVLEYSRVMYCLSH
jgi:hypothetical protein